MHGVLIINKPAGMTSHDVCAALKRRFGLKKAGHVGTLDPLATGVLPVCVNEATKLVQFLMHRDKEYCCTMQLGAATDTHDSQGTVLSRTDAVPRDPGLIRRTLREFCGELQQTPPMFSALKHNGVPLYKLARAGATVHRQQRRISIDAIDLVALEPPRVVFRVACSSGTYVRTLCHDIGRRLGCGAHMTGLERIRNGSFHISSSVALEALAALPREQALAEYLIPITAALCGLPEVRGGDAVEQKLRTGATVTLNDVRALRLPQLDSGQHLKVLSCQGNLIGIVAALPAHGNDGGPAWKTVRVFAR